MHVEVRDDARMLALFVEPHAETLLMYREYFRAEGIEIDAAGEGREALAKALHRPHDVIVTETRLLGINGYDLCDVLRHDPATRTTPIVVLTGDAFPRDIAHANRAGADCVLIKPCLPDVLLSEVQRLHLVRQRSAELRIQSAAIRDRVAQQIIRSEDIGDRAAHQIARSYALQRSLNGRRERRALSKSLARGMTTAPHETPPQLVCPSCDQPLAYRDSYLGGVSERFREQWDYFECSKGCGTFQYRHRTRKVRRVS